ncbi:MAG: hypothetical protein WCS73_02875 [Lentisphaeria bacterium]
MFSNLSHLVISIISDGTVLLDVVVVLGISVLLGVIGYRALPEKS